MSRDRNKRIYALHSWVGVVFGLLLFAVSFSGTVSLYYQELLTWEDPNYRLAIAAQPVSLDNLVDNFVSEMRSKGRLGSLYVFYPKDTTPYYQAAALVRTPDRKQQQILRRWDTATGNVLPERGDGMAYWLVNLHRKLMLPGILGRTLVGLCGVVLMLSIVTGIVTHRKMLREMFTLRIDRSIRLKWKDTHNILGVWGLPFHAMMGVTGAFLALDAVFLPLIASIAFHGDRPAATHALTTPPPIASGQPAAMQSLDRLPAYIAAQTGDVVRAVGIEHWNDRTATFRILAEPNAALARYVEIKMNGASGKIEHRSLAGGANYPDNATGRVLAAFTALHYATFGGIWLKYLYTALGAALCVMVTMGIMVWIERRAYGHAGNDKTPSYRILTRLTVGITLGMMIATIGILYVDKLLNAAAPARLFWIGVAYLFLWCGTIAYAFAPDNAYRATRQLVGIAAVGFIGLPLLNYLVTQEHFIALWQHGQPHAAGVDMFGAIFGILLLAVAWRLPDRRS